MPLRGYRTFVLTYGYARSCGYGCTLLQVCTVYPARTRTHVHGSCVRLVTFTVLPHAFTTPDAVGLGSAVHCVWFAAHCRTLRTCRVAYICVYMPGLPHTRYYVLRFTGSGSPGSCHGLHAARCTVVRLLPFGYCGSLHTVCTFATVAARGSHTLRFCVATQRLVALLYLFVGFFLLPVAFGLPVRALTRGCCTFTRTRTVLPFATPRLPRYGLLVNAAVTCVVRLRSVPRVRSCGLPLRGLHGYGWLRITAFAHAARVVRLPSGYRRNTLRCTHTRTAAGSGLHTFCYRSFSPRLYGSVVTCRTVTFCVCGCTATLRTVRYAHGCTHARGSFARTRTHRLVRGYYTVLHCYHTFTVVRATVCGCTHTARLVAGLLRTRVYVAATLRFCSSFWFILLDILLDSVRAHLYHLRLRTRIHTTRFCPLHSSLRRYTLPVYTTPAVVRYHVALHVYHTHRLRFCTTLPTFIRCLPYRFLFGLPGLVRAGLFYFARSRCRLTVCYGCGYAVHGLRSVRTVVCLCDRSIYARCCLRCSHTFGYTFRLLLPFTLRFTTPRARGYACVAARCAFRAHCGLRTPRLRGYTVLRLLLPLPFTGSHYHVAYTCAFAYVTCIFPCGYVYYPAGCSRFLYVLVHAVCYARLPCCSRFTFFTPAYCIPMVRVLGSRLVTRFTFHVRTVLVVRYIAFALCVHAFAFFHTRGYLVAAHSSVQLRSYTRLLGWLQHLHTLPGLRHTG